jgi:hypothetical protein
MCETTIGLRDNETIGMSLPAGSPHGSLEKAD